jgi:hypothetical protein
LCSEYGSAPVRLKYSWNPNTLPNFGDTIATIRKKYLDNIPRPFESAAHHQFLTETGEHPPPKRRQLLKLSHNTLNNTQHMTPPTITESSNLSSPISTLPVANGGGEHSTGTELTEAGSRMTEQTSAMSQVQYRITTDSSQEVSDPWGTRVETNLLMLATAATVADTQSISLHGGIDPMVLCAVAPGSNSQQCPAINESQLLISSTYSSVVENGQHQPGNQPCPLSHHSPTTEEEHTAQGTRESDPNPVGLETCTGKDGPLSPAYSEFISWDTLLPKE